MRAYEFYLRNKREGARVIGVLPERRRGVRRITRGSVIKWLRTVLGDKSGVDFKNIYFVQMEV